MIEKKDGENDLNYKRFLQQKKIVDIDSGFKRTMPLNKMLFPFQKKIVEWALIRGRSAIFADCGLGKTPIQLEWARHINKKMKKPVLIIAPLAVSKQTKQEGRKFNISINICRKQSDIKQGINITNYEMLHSFVPDDFSGLVLDESSILKSYDGKLRKQITEFALAIPYRLACTATPAPNDIIELTNHSEFLDVMSAKEVIALFFIQDGNTTHKWRLKRHAANDFWKWLSSWSVVLRKPSDIGYDNDGFILPKLHIRHIKVQSTNHIIPKGHFFASDASTLRERQIARMNSIDDRVRECAALVNESNDQWLIWCDLNNESTALTKAINGAVEVKGADSATHKENSMFNFQQGDIRVLVTKPSIAGFGMNWQNCHNMAFVGLSDSYEKLYQATRRCWRFGQKKEVYSYHITSNLEGAVVKNIERKEREASGLFDNVIKHMNMTEQLKTQREEMDYMETVKKGKDWTLYLGDSILTIDKLKNDSIGLSVFSPPFPGMYVYTNSHHDMGNTKSIEELIIQFKFLSEKLLKKTIPGRLMCVHLMQLLAIKHKDGYIGIKDFRGKIINMLENTGWVYYGEVCIDKNPQLQAIRNKERGLLFKTLATDSANLRMALADYLLYFKKPGDNPIPIKASKSTKYNKEGEGWITPQEWIEWAAPVWYRQTPHYPGGIKETNVLNCRLAKDKKDEKHLCPLQLGVIERAVKLWSNPGDIIYSPFVGIGSEGYVALQLNRKFIGCELKRSYFDQAVIILNSVKKRSSLFNLYQAE